MNIQTLSHQPLAHTAPTSPPVSQPKPAPAEKTTALPTDSLQQLKTGARSGAIAAAATGVAGLLLSTAVPGLDPSLRLVAAGGSAVAGGLTGAVAGAVTSQLTDNAFTGAVVGALAGAATGAVVLGVLGHGVSAGAMIGALGGVVGGVAGTFEKK